MKMQQKVENVWAAEARAAANTSQTMLKKCVGRTRPFFPVVKYCSAAYKSKQKQENFLSIPRT